MMLHKEAAVWQSLYSDPQYRREWAVEHEGVGLAFQIRALRESRGWTQAELGQRTGKAQETLSQCENPNYGRYTLSTLNKLATAFDVGLLVRFVPFSQLIDWTLNVTPERLVPPSFDMDYRRYRERITMAPAATAAFQGFNIEGAFGGGTSTYVLPTSFVSTGPDPIVSKVPELASAA